MKNNLYIDIAKRIALESKCISTKVGCVIVKDGRIISIGYNGTPIKYTNCVDWWEKNNIEKYDKFNVEHRKKHREWSDIHEIHAEMNAIMFAAKNGISIEDSTLYCTLFPCQHCLKNIVQSGIKQLYYIDEYDLGIYDQNFFKFIKKKLKIIKLMSITHHLESNDS